MLKPLPADNFCNLMFPPRGYKYFENSRDHPFLPDADGFELVNAWWLADAAVLAYEQDESYVHQCLQDAGLESEVFGDWSPGHQGTQGFIAHNASFVIVSFRGTEVNDLSDAVTDLDLALTSEDGCQVHHGFKKALDSVWPGILNSLREILVKHRPAPSVWFTGHSLGAALATIATERFDGSRLYNLGSPRVGNPAFRDKLRSQSRPLYRFINSNDAVTLAPLDSVFYTHVGNAKYFDRNGRLRNNPGYLGRWVDALLGTWRHWKRVTRQRRKTGVLYPVPPYLIGNHSPGRYPVLIWNSYVKTKGLA
jgi:triacylglycerol lipase